MKRLSKTFLRVGGIIDIVVAGSFLIAAIIFAVLASPVFTDVFVRGFENGTAQTSASGTPEEKAFAVQIVFLTLAIVFFTVVGCGIVGSVFSFKAAANYNRKMLITNIVLGFVLGSKFSSAGGILGVIALAREERNKARSNIIDAE